MPAGFLAWFVDLQDRFRLRPEGVVDSPNRRGVHWLLGVCPVEATGDGAPMPPSCTTFWIACLGTIPPCSLGVFALHAAARGCYSPVAERGDMKTTGLSTLPGGNPLAGVLVIARWLARSPPRAVPAITLRP